MTEEQSSNVRDFNPALTLGQFFDRIYKEQSGWVYVATKHAETTAWKKHFFQWPSAKREIIQFILSKTADHEVYYCPALFSNDRSGKDNPLTKSDFVGSYFIWADYDGTLPTEDQMKGIPDPTMKIRSSGGKNQHWYWELKFFETDADSLENIARRIAYATGADLSGWDYSQVLRPPATIHHESERTTKILGSTEKSYSIEAFLGIPDPPVGAWDIVVEETVEDFTSLMMRYPIPEKQIKLFREKEVPKGSRSDALMRAAYVCAEIGMNNGEIFTIIKTLDKRWGKWAPRGEDKQKKCILGTIRKARIKYPEGTLNLDSIDEEIPWMSARELRSKEIQVEWIIPGYVQKKGIFFLVSDSGVGKTHMSLMIACHMALGKPYLGFDIQRPTKIAFIQMEYSDAELKEELDRIYDTFEESELNVIFDNLDVIPKGSSVNLRSERIREMLLRRVDQFKPEGIFWDSFQVAMGGKLIESEPLNEAFDFLKSDLANKRDIFNWFIHHNRKDESTRVQRRRPKELDDVYGGQAIGAVATMVMGLWKESPGDPEIQANCLKARWAPRFDKFTIRRAESGVGFEKVVSLGQRMYLPESSINSGGSSIDDGMNIDF